MRKRVRFLLGLTLLAVVSLTACGGKEKAEEQTNSATEEQGIIDTGNMNLLTGVNTVLDEGVGKRPVAIMVNNISKGMPQYGIAAADIIFEIPIEGGGSRFMAIYGDYTQVPKVCPIRSCRKYFPELAEGFDAIYVCSGMNDDVRSYVKSLDIDMLDASHNAHGLFVQDQDRLDAGYSSEYTWYFDGTSLVETLEKQGTRTDLEEDKSDAAFNFVAKGETVTPTDGECPTVTVDFGAIEATFVYDEDSNTYLKEHNGDAQKDSVTDTQLAFTNVFLLETKVGYDDNGTNRTIDWTGGDTSVGYYVSNGSIQKIHYAKDSVDSRLVFYDEDGNELEINRGKSYIAFYPTGEISFE